MSCRPASQHPISPGGTHASFLRRVHSIPPLSATEERVLALRFWRGEESAGRRMTEANLRLVAAVATRHRGRGLEFEDLVQEGTLGLIRAIKKFDPRRGCRLSTYATWWIREAIGQALLDGGRPMRIPASAHAKLRTIERLRSERRAMLGRELTSGELGAAARLPASQLLMIRRAAQPPLSLDVATAENGSPLMDLIVDPCSAEPELPASHDLAAAVDLALGELDDPRQRYILHHHYGLHGAQPQTLRQIGTSLGLTTARVSQLKTAALTKLVSLPAARLCRDTLAA
jgi:RNA polymerase primary sigma factor